MKAQNEVLTLSRSFGSRIVKLYRYLITEHKEYILSKQIVRSGTSVGANIHEARYAQSRSDFISKMHIALKEASETEYWLFLLYDGGYLQASLYESLQQDCASLIRLLTAILNTSKKSCLSSFDNILSTPFCSHTAVSHKSVLILS